ncbi:hypothetical protein FRT59_08235 [Pseudomonas haemolytica]|uniref:Lipoprotein n=1 Tax=Pseudomonas haemolytica TaxID=2600065 RepID=A0A5P1D9D8_9PSED|nr:hypothetical protein [Pseudomonas haemolytica]
MKYLAILIAFATLGACSAYSPGQSDPDIRVGGFQISCDAVPANQPGCYSAPPSKKPSEKINLQPDRS